MIFYVFWLCIHSKFFGVVNGNVHGYFSKSLDIDR